MSGSSNKGIEVKIVLTGQEALIARFKRAPEALLSNLKQELLNLAFDMRDEAAAATNPKSGKLGDSISARITQGGSSVGISLESDNVDYARIQEQGGELPGRVILPNSAKTLAFMWAGGGNGGLAGDMSFFAAVAWPGASIPAKHFILNTLKRNRYNFTAAVQHAVDKAIKP
jgi:hypothetical protein